MTFDLSTIKPRIAHLDRLMYTLNEAIYRLRLNPDLENVTRPTLVENFFSRPGPLEISPNYYVHACTALHDVLANPKFQRPLTPSELHLLAEERSGDPIACSRACFGELWRKTFGALSPEERTLRAVQRWNLPSAHVALALGVPLVDIEMLQNKTERTLDSHRRCPHMSLISEIKRLSEAAESMKVSA
jgi:hypothetical protein